MYLRAYGDYCEQIGDTLPDLKDLVTESVGQPIRRISRFMQLALIGAGRCARGLSLPAETAVYLASSRGDLEISVDVSNHMFREGQAPKPLSFVNTVSNSAAFYVAKCLGLQSRSAFVSSRYFAFESALQLALTDFRLGTVDSALIGCVESAVLPLSAHRERLEVDGTVQLAEASHWLWLARDGGEPAHCSLLDAQGVSNRDALMCWIASQQLDSSSAAICRGQFMTDDDFARIRLESRLEPADYRPSRAYYPSHSAAEISRFLRDTAVKTLLHVNGDPIGRYAAFSLSRTR